MKRISSGSPFEELAGYSRAVVDDNYIFISGTVGIDPITKQIPATVLDQLNNIFATIEQVLQQEKCTLEHVTHCRVYIADESVLTEVVSFLGQKFRNFRPANTTLFCQIPAPGAKVEIEVTARLVLPKK